MHPIALDDSSLFPMLSPYLVLAEADKRIHQGKLLHTPFVVSIIDSSLVLFIAVVILIFLVVLYWLRIPLLLLDQGSKLSPVLAERSLAESFLFAAANTTDKGSISTSLSLIESGSTMTVDDTFGVVLAACDLLV